MAFQSLTATPTTVSWVATTESRIIIIIFFCCIFHQNYMISLDEYLLYTLIKCMIQLSARNSILRIMGGANSAQGTN